MLLTSCGTTFESDRALRAETAWNHLGIWRRVADEPASYVPKSYPKGRTPSDKEGQWFVDRRDGKRLFVPCGGVGSWSEGVLLGEAQKITDTPPPKAELSSRELARSFVGAAQGLVMAMAQARAGQ